MRRLAAIALLLFALWTAPYWLHGAEYLAGYIANLIESTSQAYAQNYSQNPFNINITQQYEPPKPFEFSFYYRDSESNINIEGTHERVRLVAEFTGSAWQRIKERFQNFLHSIGIKVQISNR